MKDYIPLHFCQLLLCIAAFYSTKILLSLYLHHRFIALDCGLGILPSAKTRGSENTNDNKNGVFLGN